MLTIYADDELGAFGWVEKPWYRPGERLTAFLDEMRARGLAADRAEAPPATDEELALFHTPEHIASIVARCASGRGSLDRAPDHVNERSRRLATAIAAAPGPWVTAAELAPTLDELASTLAEFAPFLQSEDLVHYDADADAVQLTEEGRSFLADPDATLGGPTYARAHVERAARHICGAMMDAVRRITAGELSTVFVPIAGFHHAHRDEARLYCLYNDPGLAIEAALRAVDGTVAYVDVDIHHGDGVYGAFVDDPRVAIVDLHEGRDVEPGGQAETAFGGAGTKRAIALGTGNTDESYLAAWSSLEQSLREADPDFIVFEAGVDGLATDPMSDQALTPDVFREIARRVKAVADEHAEGRLLVLGGGGYELTGLAAGWAAVVEGLTAG